MTSTFNSDSIVMQTMQENSLDQYLHLPSVLNYKLIQAQNTIIELQQQVKTLQAQIQIQEQKLGTIDQIISQIDGEIINLLSNSPFKLINQIQSQVIEKEINISFDKTITQIQKNFNLFLEQLEIHFPIIREKSRIIKKIVLIKPENQGQKKFEKNSDQLIASNQKDQRYSKTEPTQFYQNRF